MSPLRDRLREVIFEADTPAGRLFDVALIVAILASVVVVMLDSVEAIATDHRTTLRTVEWIMTILFTLEYACRLYSVRRPLRYATSFYGIVDLLSIVPTYLSLVLTGAQTLLVIRVLRILRMFRILKLARYVREGRTLLTALRASVPKIIVFLFGVFTVVVVMGAVMHLIEGPENPGFGSIPHSMYWAIVTLTTVGYGDVTPETNLGKAISMLIMVLGYGILAVPTGIVSVELSHAARTSLNTRGCASCAHQGHDDDATHCKRCGSALTPAD